MAGTSDGKKLALRLRNLGWPVLVTVTSAYGEALAQAEGLAVHTGALDAEGLSALIRSAGATVLVDATHPYASQASLNAIAAANAAGVPYLRFERPLSALEDSRAEVFETVEGLCEAVGRETGNVLLTLGSNLLEPFGRLTNRDRLYARLLPVPALVEKCIGFGFRPDHLLAMQGPFSEAFNTALIRQWQITVLVTKDSAGPGGFDEKLAAARHTGIRLFVLGRPQVPYPRVCHTEDALLAALIELSGWK